MIVADSNDIGRELHCVSTRHRPDMVVKAISER